jgi:cbb3-type cytochrome oxidase maturation protein
MSIIMVLIPLGLILMIAAVWAFFWAVKSGQYDDLETPAWLILLDDDRKPHLDYNKKRPGFIFHKNCADNYLFPKK